MEHLAPDAARPLVLLVDDKTDSHKVMNGLLMSSSIATSSPVRRRWC
ncbi:hypothetical protein [Aeromonas allosaccharophila]|nr:hypothetical protein [Aeromonas allosaccharophila]